MKNNYFKTCRLITILVCSISLYSCGGGSGSSGTSSGGNNTKPSLTEANLSIDNMGTIPVLGNNSTSTYGILRNNSSGVATNVQITTQLNYDNTTSTSSSTISAMLNSIKHLLNLQSNFSTTYCNLSANETCSFPLDTGVMSAQNSVGSILVTASWNDKEGTAHRISNIVNTQWLDNSVDNGVVLASDLIAVNKTNSGHGILYAYGSGQNNIYTITQAITSNDAIKFNQNTLNNTVIPAGFVTAIPLNFSVANSTYSGSITLNSVISGKKSSQSLKKSTNMNIMDTSGGYTSNATIGVISIATANSGYLIAGSTPITDLSTSAGDLTKSFNVANVGNAKVDITSIVASAGSNLILSNTCGSSIESNASCTVSYTIPSAQDTTNGTITINYTGAQGGVTSVINNVYWFNSKNGMLVALSASQSPLIFNSGTTGESGSKTIITATNVGGYPLTLTPQTNSVISGSAILTETVGGVSPCGATLNPGFNCTYTLTASDNVAESDQIVDLYFNGTYVSPVTQAVTQYTSIYVLKYTALPYEAILTMPVLPLLTQNGDGITSASESVVFTNVGTGPATINSFSVSGLATNITATSSPCAVGGQLLKNASCVATINFAPKLINTLVTESGIESLNIGYGTTGTILTNSVSNDIPYQILPNFQGLTLENVTLNADVTTTGSGTSASPYAFSGVSMGSQTITLAYKNLGTKTISVNSIQDNMLNPVWVRSSNTCTGIVAVNGACTIVYANQFASYLPYLLANNANLGVPTFVYTDPSNNAQYVATPPLPSSFGTYSTTLYGNLTNVATVINNVSVVQQVGATPPSLTVTHTATFGLAPYTSVTVVTKMENYFTTQSGPCTYDTVTTPGIMTETCVLTPGTPSMATTYTVDSNVFKGAAGNIGSLFSVSGVVPINSGVSMNTGYSSITINKTQ